MIRSILAIIISMFHLKRNLLNIHSLQSTLSLFPITDFVAYPYLRKSVITNLLHFIYRTTVTFSTVLQLPHPFRTFTSLVGFGSWKISNC